MVPWADVCVPLLGAHRRPSLAPRPPTRRHCPHSTYSTRFAMPRRRTWSMSGCRGWHSPSFCRRGSCVCAPTPTGSQQLVATRTLMVQLNCFPVRGRGLARPLKDHGCAHIVWPCRVPEKICEFLEAPVAYTLDMLALHPGPDVVRSRGGQMFAPAAGQELITEAVLRYLPVHSFLARPSSLLWAPARHRPVTSSALHPTCHARKGLT